MTGWATKIIAMTEALGTLIRFVRIPRQHFDTVGVAPLIEPADFNTLLADKAFDIRWICEASAKQDAKAVISHRKNRIITRPYDRDTYKARYLIKNFFEKLKEFRGIAIRSAKTDQAIRPMIYLAAAVINLR